MKKRSLELTFQTIVILALLLLVLIVGTLFFSKYFIIGQSSLDKISKNATKDYPIEIDKEIKNIIGESN